MTRARREQETREQQDRTRFLELIRGYADIRELDAATLNHLVRKIVIQGDIDGDARRQTVEIHFNFSGQVDKISLIPNKNSANRVASKEKQGH